MYRGDSGDGGGGEDDDDDLTTGGISVSARGWLGWSMLTANETSLLQRGLV